jgi:hypothetical protein
MSLQEQLDDLSRYLGRRFAEERERLTTAIGESINIEHDRISAAIDEMRWGGGETLVKLQGDIAAAVEEVAKVCGEADAALGIRLDELTQRADLVPPVVEEISNRVADYMEFREQTESRIDELVTEVAAAEERLAVQTLEKLREERLEAQEQLLAARRRYDRLCEDMTERLAALKDGEPGPAGEPGPEGPRGPDGRTGEARGKYDPDEAYAKLDRVSFNGSEWIARSDDPGPLPGDGWMLAARAGSQGRSGERGPRGERGEAGAGITGIACRDWSLVLRLTDGRETIVDLRPMFERYDQERGE